MVYKWYILPIGWLYITYHLLREPENSYWCWHIFFFGIKGCPQTYIPWTLTWNVKISTPKQPIFGFHVSFRGVRGFILSSYYVLPFELNKAYFSGLSLGLVGGVTTSNLHGKSRLMRGWCSERSVSAWRHLFKWKALLRIAFRLLDLGPWNHLTTNYKSVVVLHGVMGFPVNGVTGGNQLSYFTPRTGVISPLGAHFEAMTAKKHLLLAILLVPFLGCLSDPFNGCWWPPRIGDKKVTLNHLVLVMSSIMALCFGFDLFSCGCSSQWFRD